MESRGMTIKGMATIARVARSTVARHAKILFPEKSINGKKTYFDEDESIRIMDAVRKRGFMNLPKNGRLPVQNAQV